MSGCGCFHAPTAETAWPTKPNVFAVGPFAEKVCQPRPYNCCLHLPVALYTKCRKDWRLLTRWGETLTDKHTKTKTLVSSSIFLVMKLHRNQPTREPSPALALGRKGTDRGQGQSWACLSGSSLSGGFPCRGGGVFHVYRITVESMLRLPGMRASWTLTQSRSLRRGQKTYLRLSFGPYRNRRRPVNHPGPRPPESPSGFQTTHGQFCLPHWRARRCRGAGGRESRRPSVCKREADSAFSVPGFLLFVVSRKHNKGKRYRVQVGEERGEASVFTGVSLAFENYEK